MSNDTRFCVDCWVEGVQLVLVETGEHSSPDTYRCLPCYASNAAGRVTEELLTRIAVLEKRVSELEKSKACGVATESGKGGDA